MSFCFFCSSSSLFLGDRHLQDMIKNDVSSKKKILSEGSNRFRRRWPFTKNLIFSREATTSFLSMYCSDNNTQQRQDSDETAPDYLLLLDTEENIEYFNAIKDADDENEAFKSYEKISPYVNNQLRAEFKAKNIKTPAEKLYWLNSKRLSGKLSDIQKSMIMSTSWVEYKLKRIQRKEV